MSNVEFHSDVEKIVNGDSSGSHLSSWDGRNIPTLTANKDDKTYQLFPMTRNAISTVIDNSTLFNHTHPMGQIKTNKFATKCDQYDSPPPGYQIGEQLSQFEANRSTPKTRLPRNNVSFSDQYNYPPHLSTDSKTSQRFSTISEKISSTVSSRTGETLKFYDYDQNISGSNLDPLREKLPEISDTNIDKIGNITEKNMDCQIESSNECRSSNLDNVRDKQNYHSTKTSGEIDCVLRTTSPDHPKYPMMNR